MQNPVPMRTILHIDMDAFYAAVEQRDDPELRGRPIAVGGGSGRGVVMTASYEARRYGVRSAMPGATARRLCPDLLFVRPRFAAYREASRAIRAVFAEWTDLIEPLALDEAYLDVSAATEGAVGGVDAAQAIKQRIVEVTGLTASAGVSFNKFLAKRASEIDKPDGLVEITPDDAPAFIDRLPIGQFHGIGPRTATKLQQLGIATGRDLRERGEAWLTARLGRLGIHLARLARGEDDRLVSPNRPRRSTSVEHTFGTDLVDRTALDDAVGRIAGELAERLAGSGFRGRAVILKIKHADFTLATRRTTLSRPAAAAHELAEAGLRLLHHPGLPSKPVRLLGLGVATAFGDDPRQLALGLASGAAIDQGNGQT